MQASISSSLVLRAYIGFMLLFLLLPLIVTAGAALNDARFPSVWPWEGWTTRWFVDLWQDTRFWTAVKNTAIIATGVTVLAVPLGTASAIILNSLNGKSRTFVYAMMTAPILTPGAVVGISTLMFWRAADVPAGLTITTFGQVSVIAAYVMLLVLARLQSFDQGLEEAALDLGASHAQVIRMILFPYLRPAMLMGGMIAFLQSTESYNVPLFTRGGNDTVMTFIASKVRTGVTPMVNALALLLLVVSVLAGILYEYLRRREAARKRQMERMARKAEALEEIGVTS